MVETWRKYVDDKKTARDFRAQRSGLKLKFIAIEAF
jgi:hypothetical protein